MKRFSLILVLVSLACTGPYKTEQFVEIGPNETAFMVPLEGDSLGGQAKFQSVDFLQQSRVAGKRVSLPLRRKDTGRPYWSYEYIPTARVIKVDRTPITREWTTSEGTGSEKKDQGIHVESVESIGFAVGLNLTAGITEEDAATFLYWYAAKPLTEVVDQNVRGFCGAFLAREFAPLSLDLARTQKAVIITKLTDAVRDEFKKYGITVMNLGAAEGLTYQNNNVQQAIDNAWTAQRTLERAKVDAETRVINAEAAAKAEVAAAEGEAKANQIRSNSITPTILRMRTIEKWDGKLPKATGGAVPMMNLD